MQLRLTDALAFGALISAVDPVATLAIFSAMDVEPVLNMLGTDIKSHIWNEILKSEHIYINEKKSIWRVYSK